MVSVKTCGSQCVRMCSFMYEETYVQNRYIKACLYICEYLWMRVRVSVRARNYMYVCIMYVCGYAKVIIK